MSEPLAQFRHWYEHAKAAGLPEPEAMALATATPDGVPSVRLVLLKGIDERGVEFFTNYEKPQGPRADANPRAALASCGQPLQRQVRLEGPVERLAADESDAYFASRSRGSPARRLGVEAGRGDPGPRGAGRRLPRLDAHTRTTVPRPPYWGGYRLVPDAIEFWEGRPDRLHDRESFTRGVDGALALASAYPRRGRPAAAADELRAAPLHDAAPPHVFVAAS